MRIFLILIVALMLSACDSPRNHRVEGGTGATSDLSLSSLKNFMSAEYSVRSQWVHGPFGNVQEPSTLMVFLYDKDGKLTSLPEGREINFNASMSMGHGINEVGYFTAIAPGIYLNTDIHFMMDGPWNMELYLQDADYNILDKVQWSESF